REIEEMLEEDEEMREQVELLESMKGVGKVTAVTLLVKLPELGRVSHKKIAKLVGVAPMSEESGKRKGKRKIKGGRGEVRAALYMATLVAIRFNPVIREYYERLLSRGKAKKAAMVACMRKMLIILNAMMRDKRKFKAGDGRDVSSQKTTR
ncbi:MAG: transposase, partial [Armatimonadota bacterium]